MTPQKRQPQPQNSGVFGGMWLLWFSDKDACYVTRASQLTDQQLRDGYAMTLAADTLDELKELLRAQPDWEEPA